MYIWCKKVLVQQKIIIFDNNSKYNRILAPVEWSAHPTSVMVWSGITSDAKTLFVLVKTDVSINQKYYPWTYKTMGPNVLGKKEKKKIFPPESAPVNIIS